jgi:ribosomal protein S18 acetylase RimI-like enzyme
MSGSGIIVRTALEQDTPALAELAIMASHGVMNLLYEGLIPGRSVAEAIIERRLRNPDSFCALRHWRVAQDARGSVLGGLNSLPNVELAKSVGDPAIGPERLAPLTRLFELDVFLADAYYVNMIAVFPQHRRSGAGRALMLEAERLARQSGLCTIGLTTFEADAGLIAFYHKLGFSMREKRPIPPHPQFEFSGNWVLMIRDLLS